MKIFLKKKQQKTKYMKIDTRKNRKSEHLGV